MCAACKWLHIGSWLFHTDIFVGWVWMATSSTSPSERLRMSCGFTVILMLVSAKPLLIRCAFAVSAPLGFRPRAIAVEWMFIVIQRIPTDQPWLVIVAVWPSINQPSCVTCWYPRNNEQIIISCTNNGEIILLRHYGRKSLTKGEITWLTNNKWPWQIIMADRIEEKNDSNKENVAVV